MHLSVSVFKVVDVPFVVVTQFLRCWNICGSSIKFHHLYCCILLLQLLPLSTLSLHLQEYANYLRQKYCWCKLNISQSFPSDWWLRLPDIRIVTLITHHHNSKHGTFVFIVITWDTTWAFWTSCLQTCELFLSFYVFYLENPTNQYLQLYLVHCVKIDKELEIGSI